MAPLLFSLRTGVLWARRDTVRRGDGRFIKLTGALPANPVPTSADASRPELLPRQCRLYLDIDTLWPHRIEWWGCEASHFNDVALLQMEFRDPVLNQPLSTDRCDREFTFPVAVERAFNQTPEMIERMRRLLAQPEGKR